jgi:type III secretion protein J
VRSGQSGSRISRLALGALLLLACNVPIAAGLEENDASQAVVVLERAGVAAEKERDPEKEGAFRVVVGRDDAAAALAVLGAEGLPPRAAPGVLDALGKGSLVPSRLAEHARLVTGTGGDLERSLKALDGVISARVHLAVPPRDPLELGEEPELASASVLIRHRGATPPLAASEIQRLVAGAVPGLQSEQVSVVMTPVAAAARPPDRELSRFGPLTVTRASMTPLRAIVAVGVVLNALLLGAVLALFARMRRAEHALAEQHGEGPKAAALRAKTADQRP